ncbi:MAG: MarR family transcriptional regulator [Bacillota bacterium]
MAERYEELEQLLKAVNRGLHELFRDLREVHGLPASSMVVLGHVFRRPRTTVSELAREIGMAKSHVSKTVESLTALGLLEKTPDPEDHRLLHIQPTEKTRENFRRMKQAMSQRFSGIVSALPPEKIDSIIESLRVLQSALDQETHQNSNKG